MATYTMMGPPPTVGTVLLTQPPPIVYNSRRTTSGRLDSKYRFHLTVQLDEVMATKLSNSIDAVLRDSPSHRVVATPAARGPFYPHHHHHPPMPALVSTPDAWPLSSVSPLIGVEVVFFDGTMPFVYVPQDEADGAHPAGLHRVPRPNVSFEFDGTTHVLRLGVLPKSMPLSSSHAGRPFRLAIALNLSTVLLSDTFIMQSKERRHDPHRDGPSTAPRHVPAYSTFLKKAMEPYNQTRENICAVIMRAAAKTPTEGGVPRAEAAGSGNSGFATVGHDTSSKRRDGIGDTYDAVVSGVDSGSAGSGAGGGGAGRGSGGGGAGGALDVGARTLPMATILSLPLAAATDAYPLPTPVPPPSPQVAASAPNHGLRSCLGSPKRPFSVHLLADTNSTNDGGSGSGGKMLRVSDELQRRLGPTPSLEEDHLVPAVSGFGQHRAAPFTPTLPSPQATDEPAAPVIETVSPVLPNDWEGVFDGKLDLSECLLNTWSTHSGSEDQDDDCIESLLASVEPIMDS